ncbi:hypothetical protein QVD17_11216 [Tagetes erecta]|uniref:Uncharacterized protein n=1 Tax=Tagetes erecta TaxID=13708 RepID=A0AAD8P1V5_TARER|nr:hypothetical protein QVD17_11216 [Tagetes erecta]
MFESRRLTNTRYKSTHHRQLIVPGLDFDSVAHSLEPSVCFFPFGARLSGLFRASFNLNQSNFNLSDLTSFTLPPHNLFPIIKLDLIFGGRRS